VPNARDIWIVGETEGGKLAAATLEALCDARELAEANSGRVALVAFGPAAENLLDTAARHGADRVLVSRGSENHARSAERCATVVAQALGGEAPRLVLLAATALGREIACRLAARCRLALANDCNWVRIGADGAVEAARLIYGGRFYARVRLESQPAVVSLRPGAAGIGKPAPRARVEVEELPPLDRVCARVESVAYTPADPRTIDIAEAERIVAVGRGIGTREALALYQELADHLGAALAASRPIVDAKWLPFERQVGQTGRIVAPRLYLAAGISGASHHTLGMKGSECVVAINRDRNAEIFKLADLKVVADLHQLMPALLRQLAERQAS